jgi:hypothetical protein
MDTILDLDLDFFVWPVAHWRGRTGRLEDNECEYLASESEVRSFLEQRCHLRRNPRIPGQQFVEHRDAFTVWRRWLQDGKLHAPFGVMHVDAHADLGLGDGGWVYLVAELLAFPVDKRSEPRLGSDALNSSNYLAFAIANRWVRDLTYVFPTNPFPPRRVRTEASGTPSPEETIRKLYLATNPHHLEDQPPVEDLVHMHFQNNDWKTGLIELKQYRPEDTSALVVAKEAPAPLRAEPVVPFHLTPSGAFEFSAFTHIVVAQSPQFTPKSADKLLSVIADYFTPS